MPYDRRRPGFEGWLLSPLPWAWQDRTPSSAVRRLLYILGVPALFGPWPFAALIAGWGAWRVYTDGRKLGERKTWWALDVRTDRAYWVVRIAEDWRWMLLNRLGILWLPVAAPLSGGDVLLFDIRGREEESESVQFFMAGRLANPAFGSPRRHRRLVRVPAFWTLKDPLPLSVLAETARAAASPPASLVRAVEAADEEGGLKYHRLESKESIREQRKPTWRHERRAAHLFHKLWGSQGMGAEYDKKEWCALQNELKDAGVMV